MSPGFRRMVVVGVCPRRTRVPRPSVPSFAAASNSLRSEFWLSAHQLASSSSLLNSGVLRILGILFVLLYCIEFAHRSVCRMRRDDTDQFLTHGDDDNQYTARRGLAEMCNSFFPVSELNFQIDRVVCDYLLCFFR